MMPPEVPPSQRGARPESELGGAPTTTAYDPSAEGLFRATFDLAAVGMAHVGRDGRWLRVNARLCEIVGYQRAELMELTFQDVTHRDDLEQDLLRLRRLVAGDIDAYSMEKRYLRKDRSEVWVDLTVSAVRDAGGTPRYFIAVVQEIQRRKEAEAALRGANDRLAFLSRTAAGLLAAERPRDLLADLLGGPFDPVGIDVHLCYLTEERAGRTLLRLESCGGLGADGVATSRWIDTDAAAFSTRVARECERRVFDGVRDIQDEEMTNLAAAGVRAYACYPLLPGGRLVGTLAFGLRGRAAFEEPELELLQALTDQVAVAVQRSRSLEAERRARREAEETSRTKSAFMATVSHELRTPLNSIIGYTELLADGVPEPLSDGQRGQVERIASGARHLQQLIEEILTFSRLEAGQERATLTPVSLDDLVEDVRAVVEPLAGRKGLAFGIERDDAPDRIRTDPRKLRQVLLNLLGNAVKFTEEGGVRLSIAEEDGWLHFAVIDTGIGIREDERERMFEPFWQGESSLSLSRGGTGLGLSICRRYADLLGGEIRVDSRPGKGSSFRLLVPDRRE